MTTMTFAQSFEPARVTRRGLSMIQLHDQLWRVTRNDGEVVGYVESFAVSEGLRYRAKRFLTRQHRFVGVGDFWSIDDAVDCFA
ncbi:hypothetical protein BH09ACT3_BH09ACT3_13730 [soil metagenome]